MKKSSSRFKNRVSGNAHRQKTQGNQYGYLNLPRGINIFSEEPDSRIRLDFIPYKVTNDKHPDRNPDNGTAMEGELWYKLPFKLHRNVGVNNDSFVCPTTFGKACPICNQRSALRKEGGDADTIKSLRPSDRNLYLVVPRGVKEYEEKVHVWDISQFCFQDMLNDEIDENDDYGVFPDPEEGMTLKIRFSEESFAKNKFAKVSRIDFESREQPISEEILAQVPNLDDMLIVLSYKELENKFLEIDEEPEGAAVTDKKPPFDEDEDKDEKPADTPAPRRRSRSDDDDDEDDKPAPKSEPPAPKRKQREQPKDDDDDEDPKTVCVACDGSGENSKGKTCPVCRGTGKRPPIETKTESKPSAKDSGERCPFKHRFGIDCEDFEECDECDIWDDCYAEKEASKK